MEPNPITLLAIIPVLLGLALLHMVRRQQQSIEREKKWKKEQFKD
jgi:hypothetical protein|tara:strand:+ start:997 stop:1131 length:135 start_codon:yes stop_codon:yes gene_type:complete